MLFRVGPETRKWQSFSGGSVWQQLSPTELVTGACGFSEQHPREQILPSCLGPKSWFQSLGNDPGHKWVQWSRAWALELENLELKTCVPLF